MWIKLDELTRDQILQSGSVSNLTDKNLEYRQTEGFDDIHLDNATLNTKEDFLELNFLVTSTFDNGKAYSSTIRFYDMNKTLATLYSVSWQQLNHSQEENFIKYVFHNSDMRVYSSDPSFQYQGHWESLEKESLSIYKYKGPPGKDIWKNRHVASGGLSNPNIYFTKHLAQIIQDLDKFVRRCVQILKVI